MNKARLGTPERPRPLARSAARSDAPNGRACPRPRGGGSPRSTPGGWVEVLDRHAARGLRRKQRAFWSNRLIATVKTKPARLQKQNPVQANHKGVRLYVERRGRRRPVADQPGRPPHRAVRGGADAPSAPAKSPGPDPAQVYRTQGAAPADRRGQQVRGPAARRRRRDHFWDIPLASRPSPTSAAAMSWPVAGGEDGGEGHRPNGRWPPAAGGYRPLVVVVELGDVGGEGGILERRASPRAAPQ